MLIRTSRLVAAAIALCLSLPMGAAAATGLAVRTMETDHSIARIIVSVTWGAVNDVIARDGTGVRGSGRILPWIKRVVGRAGIEGPRVALRIDGQPRTGFWAWAGAAYRVAGYATDRQHEGSVDLAYELEFRGYPIRTTTTIRNGFVGKTFSTAWTEIVPITKRLTREVPIHVCIVIRATETDGSTRIIGVGRGTADTSDFACRLVRRIAEREAGDELDRGLGRLWLVAETEGRKLYAAGASDVLDAVRDAIRIGGTWNQRRK
jgi:hypothetical protein